MAVIDPYLMVQQLTLKPNDLKFKVPFSLSVSGPTQGTGRNINVHIIESEY